MGPFAHDGLDHGRGLPADVAPGAAVHGDVKGKIAPQDILPQKPRLPGHLQFPFDELGVHLVGGADEIEGLLGLDGVPGQDDAFDDQVGVGVDQDPVLEGARLHFIGVGADVARVRGVFVHKAPFAPGGEAGPAPPRQAGLLEGLDQVLGG